MTISPSSLRPIALRAATSPAFELPGIRFTALAAPSRGSRELCAWMITVDAGLRSPAHHCIDRDELFLVTSGALQLHPDSEILEAGDAAVVPAGAPILLSNPGSHPATAYVALPVGFSATQADGTEIGTPPWAR